jgi:uncharacterized damage-inducible protein DinB
MKELAPILNFLKISRARFISTANEISDQKWRQSPARDVWSAAEIVAHLAMVEESIVARCRKESQTAPQPLPLLRKIHPPLALATWRGKKVRSPLSLDADQVHDRQRGYSVLQKTREASVAFLESSSERDLSAHHFPHPIFGSLNVYEWYRFIGYHELRHRKQLRELVEIFHP